MYILIFINFCLLFLHASAARPLWILSCRVDQSMNMTWHGTTRFLKYGTTRHDKMARQDTTIKNGVGTTRSDWLIKRVGTTRPHWSTGRARHDPLIKRVGHDTTHWSNGSGTIRPIVHTGRARHDPLIKRVGHDTTHWPNGLDTTRPDIVKWHDGSQARHDPNTTRSGTMTKRVGARHDPKRE